jgi:hypothetical protein
MPVKTLLTPQRVALAVVATVAGAAFALSYRALALGAERSGAVPLGMSLLVPVAIDGLQLASYLMVVARALRGERAPGPWTGVVLAAAASIAGNIAAAPPTLPARLWSTVAPVSLLLALRHLETEYRLAAKRRQLAEADPMVRARAIWQAEEVDGGRRLSARELGERTGTPRRTASDWLVRFRAEAHQNEAQIGTPPAAARRSSDLTPAPDPSTNHHPDATKEAVA